VTDPRAVLAARNNADLHAAVFAARRLRFERSPDGFAALDAPPPLFAHAVTATPGTAAALLARVRSRHGPREAVKDSFLELDPAAERLRPLFAASWIWRAPTGRPAAPGWHRVATETALAAWEAAWSAGAPMEDRHFPALLLDRPDVAIFAAGPADAPRAGCIANLSENCVGLSNAFGGLAKAADAAASLAPDLPLVGYERGAALETALRSGFAAVGRLRVLIPA
jgi:hypothetical protein